jgi:hypothetical protein
MDESPLHEILADLSLPRSLEMNNCAHLKPVQESVSDGCLSDSFLRPPVEHEGIDILGG